MTMIPFTRGEYELLPESYPAELIGGYLVKEPAPTFWHQELVRRLYESFRSCLPPGRVQFAPLDFFIDDENILQPDLLVLPEGTRPGPEIREIPAPILVAEVLSPSTLRRDRVVKTAIYLRAGVREVWLVDPEQLTIEVRYAAGIVPPTSDAVARSIVVPGIAVDPEELFRPG